MKWLIFAWKNVMRNRRRSLTAMLITALGTAAVLASGGFALFTYESLEEMTARDTGHVVVAGARGFDGDEDVPLQHGLADAAALTAKFAALPGVRAVAPRAQFSGLISNGDKSAVFVGSGVVPEVDFRLRGPQLNFIAGQPPATNASAPEVVIGNELAHLMKAKVGSSLTLLATTTEGNLNAVDVVVSGIAGVGVPEIDRRLVLADLASVQKLLLSDKVGTLSIYLKETADTEAIAARVREIQPDLAVKTWRDLAVFYTAVRALYNRIFGILGVIMICIVLFAMSNTLGMAVVERTREIGTLRAIGTLPGEIVRNFVYEGMVIGGTGAAAGMLLAGMATFLLLFAGIEMPPPPGRSVGYPLFLSFSPLLYGAAGLVVIVLAAGAAWLVSRRAANKPVTEALAHV
ncbi:MAG: ABC transporter permease [Sulfuritalea sp.]|nr:ABC transporter permease [Sulfuritalea sp.]MDP1983821.1 ABC transporter permease [Sulfuritalea sp.]